MAQMSSKASAPETLNAMPWIHPKCRSCRLGRLQDRRLPRISFRVSGLGLRAQGLGLFRA